MYDGRRTPWFFGGRWKFFDAGFGLRGVRIRLSEKQPRLLLVASKALRRERRLENEDERGG